MKGMYATPGSFHGSVFWLGCMVAEEWRCHNKGMIAAMAKLLYL